MTFKHTDSKDSDIMKYYEREAYNSGMATPEPVVKSASAPLMTHSSSLDQNILRLCNELRSRGLESKANELETNFLSFKVAGYGEKEVAEAHPETPQFGDSEYGIIENILQEHEKILEVINKKPTGKLTNAKNIIKSVKHVLGQELEIEFGDAIMDEPKLEVEIGNAIMDKPKSEWVVDIGDAVLDGAKKRVKGASKKIFKKAYSVSEDDRNNAAVDTIKGSLNKLNDMVTALQFVPKIDKDNMEDLVAESLKLSKDISEVSSETISSNINHIIGKSANLKRHIVELKDSQWEWFNRGLGDNNAYLEGMNKVINLFNSVLEIIVTANKTLKGDHDDFLIKYHTGNTNVLVPKVTKIFDSAINKLNDLKSLITASNDIDQQQKIKLVNYIDSEFLPYVRTVMSETIGSSELKRNLNNNSVMIAQQKIDEIFSHASYKSLTEWV